MNDPYDSGDNNQSSADSIYRAPSSDTTVAPTDNLIGAYLGPRNAHYYQTRFAKFDSGQGYASWNWPAFFFTWFWLAYRKMWGLFFAYWLLLPIVMVVLSIALGAVAGPAAGTAFYYSMYGAIAFIVVPIYANKLYFNHANGKIAKVSGTSMSSEQQALELARIGGTSNMAIVLIPVVLIFLLGIVAAIAIPAYQDYTIRAQVSEGLYLSAGAKAAVSEYYLDTEQWPADNATVGLSESYNITGKYVAEVEVQGGLIVITYGNDAHTVIADRSIELYPSASGDGRVMWDCSSPDIAGKHLPAACR